MANSRSTSATPQKKTQVIHPGSKTTSLHQQRFKANEYDQELLEMREALRSFREGDFTVELPHILQVMEEYLPEKPAAKKEDD